MQLLYKFRKKLSERVVTLVALACVIVFSGTMFFKERFDLKNSYERASTQTLVAHANFFKNFFVRASDSTRFTAHHPTLLDSIRDDQFDSKSLRVLFESVMVGQPEFVQLRYLDNTGEERIRYDRSKVHDDSIRIPEDQLQDKSNRYYFTETMNSPSGVYWSKSDLNIEHGQVEIPHKPVKRLGIQVKVDGETQGMVIANIGLKDLIRHFEENTRGETFYIVDDDQEIIWDSQQKWSWGRSLGHVKSFDTQNLAEGIYETGVYIEKINMQDIKNPAIHTSYTLVWDRRVDINTNLVNLALLYGFLMIAVFLVLRLLIRGYFDVQNSLDETSQKLSDSEHQLMLQSKHAVMGEMLSMIAHQWKQPLGITTSNVSILEMMIANGEFKAEDRQILNELFEVTNLMLDEQAKTIKDFQDYLKPGKEKEIFAMESVMQDVQTMMKPLMDKKGIQLSVESVHVNLWGRPRELQQILVNLIKNSADQHEVTQTEKPWISVFVRETSSGALKIGIEDNAGGIEKDMLPSLFSRYATSKSKSDGTGLGLYMTRMILEDQFMGEIKARNTESGALFTISIPIISSDKH